MLPPPKADAPSALEVARNAAIAAAAAPPDVETARNCGSMFYFEPRELVAGAPASIYFNRARSADGLVDSVGLKMHYGVDGWAGGPAGPAVDLQAAGLPDGDWWRGRIPPLPASSSELNFVFSDAAGAAWDNANGADYSARVLSLEEAAVAVAPRRVLEAVEHEHAGGILHILTLAPREGAAAGTKAEARAARWQEEKILRVWTPPGWQRGKAPPGGYPVLYCCDAQNLFEDWLAHQGLSWRAAESLAALIASGSLPPMILVGIDAAGAFRSLNLLPFPPGTGLGNFRPECARWPGGGVDAFLRRVIGEVLPLAESRFGASRRRERRAFGGASFGGVAALQAALAHGDVFGGVLAESPSLWVGEGRYLETMERHSGEALPDRLFLGSGTREYSGTRDHENIEIDALLAEYHARAAAILESKGMGDGRLRFQCDEGAAHHESAWGWRLSGALMHLFHGRS
jgi:enterochelin esterase-like enzyme